MAFIFYKSDNAKNGSFDISRLKTMNPNSKWAEHSYNHMILDHIARATKDVKERAQASRELEIAVRKMKYWERHPEFDPSRALFLRKKYYMV